MEGLSDEERALLGEALRALRRERGKAWNAAGDVAEAVGAKSNGWPEGSASVPPIGWKNEPEERFR
jgi:hypothetical protein